MDNTIPEICLLRHNPRFDCSISGGDKERCAKFENGDYLWCTAFSNWFWYKAYKSVNIKKETNR